MWWTKVLDDFSMVLVLSHHNHILIYVFGWFVLSFRCLFESKYQLTKNYYYGHIKLPLLIKRFFIKTLLTDRYMFFYLNLSMKCGTCFQLSIIQFLKFSILIF